MEGERRKLLDAYYAGAIDLAVLRAQQQRIAGELRAAQQQLAAADATLGQWREVLETAMRFAADRAQSYRRPAEGPAGCSTRRCSTASRPATAGSPASATRHRSTCSSARAGSNTMLW